MILLTAETIPSVLAQWLEIHIRDGKKGTTMTINGRKMIWNYKFQDFGKLNLLQAIVWVVINMLTIAAALGVVASFGLICAEGIEADLTDTPMLVAEYLDLMYVCIGTLLVRLGIS